MLNITKINSSLQLFIESFSLICIGTFLIILYFTHGLAFYIRPDYFLFTLITGSIITIAGIINLFIFFFPFFKKHAHLTGEHFDEGVTGSLFLILVLICGVVLPHKVLSAQAALRRGSSQNMLTAANPSQSVLQTQFSEENPLFLSANSNTFTIADWVRSFSVNPEPEDYRGKSVSVDGFVQPNANGTFTISRFVITCCAVDATPIGLLVDQPIGTLQADDWVHIEGKFSSTTSNSQRTIIIEPTKVQKITQPTDPYLY